jgi:acetyl esterase/lipase
MKQRHLIWILLVLTGNFSLHAQEDTAFQRLYKNVLYKVADTEDSLLLDIFLPGQVNAGQKIPVVIIIHGGAWVEGNRSLDSIYYMRQLREQLIRKGYGVVSIDYTLVSKTVHLPVPVMDCKDAVRWIRANAAQYNFDPDNIGVWGGSAGGHLALLTAYTTDNQWRGDPHLSSFSARVNYIVDNFGPTDLNAVLQTDAGKLKLFFAKLFMRKLLQIREKLIFALTGFSIATDKKNAIATARLFSPLQYADSGAVPTLIIHSIKDKVVPVKQSKKLCQVLAGTNIYHECVILKKGDHGLNNISNAETDSLVRRTVEFIVQQTHQK